MLPADTESSAVAGSATAFDAPASAGTGSVPASDAKDACLIVCSFEITSSPAKALRNDSFEPFFPDYALTIYFSDLIRGEQVDGKPNFIISILAALN